MGRTVFSLSEADEIRRLLHEKAIADRDRQKMLRGRLRRQYSFYISDFTDRAEGFAASDFDELVARGTIAISSGTRPSAPGDGGGDVSAPTYEERASEQVLPDVLEPGLRVVFCGTAVGTTSARLGTYYAGRGNEFWGVLHRVGLTPRVLSPSEFRGLPEYGIGLTDLAKTTLGSDADVSASAFDVDATREKIESFDPKVLAFNGKRAAEAFLGRPVAYGLQRETIGKTAIFVLPSTSSAARGYWDESHWQDVAQFCSTAHADISPAD